MDKVIRTSTEMKGEEVFDRKAVLNKLDEIVRWINKHDEGEEKDG